MMPSIPQLLIVLAIVVLVFGAKRLRNLGGDLGAAVKGFKSAVKNEDEGADQARIDEATAERVADTEDATTTAEKDKV